MTNKHNTAQERAAEGDSSLVELTGKIDFRNSESVRELLREAVRRHCNVQLRLCNVDFMDSSGLSALIEAAKLAQQLEGSVRLVDPTRRLRHMLDVTGFSALFAMEIMPPPAAPERRRALDMPVNTETTFLLPCRPDTMTLVRARVVELAKRLPFNAEEIADIQLAVGEAVSNAYRHGCPEGKCGTIGLKCRINSDGIYVEVRDCGPGFDPAKVPPPVPGELSPGGRGIFFMRSMMDTVSFTFDEGTTVHLHKRLSPTPDS